jgi:hypothetical protein
MPLDSVVTIEKQLKDLGKLDQIKGGLQIEVFTLKDTNI